MLRTFDDKAAIASFKRRKTYRNTVHRDAIKWWLVTFRANGLTENSSARQWKRNALAVESRHCRCNGASRLCSRNHLLLLPGAFAGDSPVTNQAAPSPCMLCGGGAVADWYSNCCHFK